MNRPRHHAIAVWVTILVGASTVRLHAATFSDDNWTSMSGAPGAQGPVWATAVDASGNLYIGGEFDIVGDVFATNIAKWNGTNWSALGAGLRFNNGYAVVYALAVSGSDLFAGGLFTVAGGVAANYIAKWNGTNWSALGSGMAGGGSAPTPVLSLTLSGNDLYAGGIFTTAGGNAANCIAKWDGNSWSALGSGLSGAPPFRTTRVLALTASGSDLYVGGAFTNAGGIVANGIAKWDGGSWSALGSGVGGTVTALAVFGSEVYANGSKWNGSNWSVLDFAVGSGVGYPEALTVSGGELFAGGVLEIPVGEGAVTYRAYVAKWTGSNWSELGTGFIYDWRDTGEPTVYSLCVSGTNVYAGGAFRSAGDIRAHCIAKWNGTDWSALGSKFQYLSAMTVSCRDVYGAGGFAATDGTQSNYVVKWNGGDWSPLAPLNSGIVSDVTALAVAGNDLYVGGTFTNVAGISANRIAKWDGINWSALGSGINGYSVNALAISGYELYAAGSFTMAGGVAANNIAKWDGTNWSALGSGTDRAIRKLVVCGRDIYAAGSFLNAGDIAANSIAKWDGTNWFSLGSGIADDVYALAAAGTNLYVGGYFFEAGGVAVTSIAKWDGSSWSAVGASSLFSYDFDGPDVYALAASGTDLYVGGFFATEFGDYNIAKWNGTYWSGIGSGVNEAVGGLAVSDADLLAAGSFTIAGGKISPNVARVRVGSIIKSVAAANGTASIQLSGVTGYQYDVQRATDFNSPVPWTTITTSPLSPASDGSFTFTDTNAPPGTAFYRAMELP